MERNGVERALDSIDEFLKLNPDDTDQGKDIAEKIIDDSEEIGSLLEEKNRIRYEKIVSRIENIHSKLSSDLINSKKLTLSSDWEKIARKDLLRLKDSILSLQEFLKNRETTLRKRWNEKKIGIDLENLAGRIKNEDSVDEVTKSKFTNLVDELEEEEIRKMSIKLSERIDRISKWLLTLKEVRKIAG